MRREEIGSHGVGGGNESWWYLCHDDATGETWIEHHWNQLNWGKLEKGRKRIALADLDPGQLQKAAKHAAKLGAPCVDAVAATIAARARVKGRSV